MKLDKYLTYEILKYLNTDEKIIYYVLFKTKDEFNNFISKLRIFKALDNSDIYKYFNKTNFNKKIIHKLPILEFNQRFCLGDYIDNIKKKDLKYPIMIGVDAWERPYITFRYDDHRRQRNNAITVFQRYTNDKQNWTFGGLCGPPPESLGDNISRIQELPNKLYKYILENAILETEY
jgi:hypothetical protein